MWTTNFKSLLSIPKTKSRGIGLTGLLLFIAAIQPGFYSPQNLMTVAYYSAMLVPAVLGMHFLLLLGHFDLSIGSVAAASAVVAAITLNSDTPIWVALALASLVGAFFGSMNWLLVSYLHIPALIATLIVMGAARTFALSLTNSRIIGGLDESYRAILLGRDNAMPRTILVAFLLLLLVEFLSRRHYLFRRFALVGSSRYAVSSVGISVMKLELLGFVLAGIGAACVGVGQSARTLSASPLAFETLPLECVAACVIGGVSIQGGKGRAFGAVAGMFMLVASRNIVGLFGVPVHFKEFAMSSLLLVAILTDNRFVVKNQE